MKLEDAIGPDKDIKPNDSDSVEAIKLAEYLEALAEEDTMIDEIAKLAVVADMLRGAYEQTGNT